MSAPKWQSHSFEKLQLMAWLERNPSDSNWRICNIKMIYHEICWYIFLAAWSCYMRALSELDWVSLLRQIPYLETTESQHPSIYDPKSWRRLDTGNQRILSDETYDRRTCNMGRSKKPGNVLPRPATLLFCMRAPLFLKSSSSLIYSSQIYKV